MPQDVGVRFDEQVSKQASSFSNKITCSICVQHKEQHKNICYTTNILAELRLRPAWAQINPQIQCQVCFGLQSKQTSN